MLFDQLTELTEFSSIHGHLPAKLDTTAWKEQVGKAKPRQTRQSERKRLRLKKFQSTNSMGKLSMIF